MSGEHKHEEYDAAIIDLTERVQALEASPPTEPPTEPPVPIYGAGPVGPGTETPTTDGDIIIGDPNDYPRVINEGAAGSTFLLRGGVYGNGGTVLRPPGGATVQAYDGEAVSLRGRIVPGADTAIRGLAIIGGDSSWAEGTIHAEHNGSGARSLLVSGCDVETGGSKHGISVVGNFDGVTLVNTGITRTEGNAFGGDPAEFLPQDSNGFIPDNIVMSNVLISSRADGTNDAIQIQNCKRVALSNISFTGTTGSPFPSENWIDLKSSVLGRDAYVLRRIIFPNRAFGAFITRAKPLVEDCLFLKGANVNVLARATDHASGTTFRRCRFEADGHRFMAIETDIRFEDCEVVGGGEFRIREGAVGTVIRGSKFTDVRLSDSGTGLVCEGNEIIGGSGWDQYSDM